MLFVSPTGQLHGRRARQAAKGVLVVGLVACVGESPALATDSVDPLPRTPQERFERSYQMPSLERCDAIANQEGRFGDVSIHFHWRLKGWMTVTVTRSLGGHVRRCLEHELRGFAQEIHEAFGREDDFEDAFTLGTRHDFLPPAEVLFPIWIRANAGSNAERSAAGAALRRALPADVTVRQGCLVFAPAGEGLATAAHAWLQRHTDGIDPQWTALSLKKLAPTPNVHLHLLGAHTRAYLVIHTEGFGAGSTPVRRGSKAVDSWCLRPLDESLLKSVRDDMAASGRCWRDGPIGTLARPRFSFPTGRRYTKVRTTMHESACALDSGGEITCCGNTPLAVTGQYLDLDTAGQSMCAVATSGAAECWNLRSGSKEMTLPGPLRSISAGVNAACGVTPAGAIVCGGPGTGKTPPPPTGQFRAVSALSSCAIRQDGELLCWTAGKAERVGSGPWLQIATERDRSSEACGLHQGGAPWCWQIAEPVSSLKPAPTGLTFSQLASAMGSRCGTVDGCNLQCWRGASGLASTVVTPPCLADVSLGSPSCAVTAAGDVRCWGNDRWANDVGPGGH